MSYCSYDRIPDTELEDAVQSHFGHLAMVEKSGWYNFVCPFCGDMNYPNKKKAYVYKDKWLFRCYKCGASQHLMQYLKENDEEAFKNLLIFGFNNDEEHEHKKEKQEKKAPSVLPFVEGELVPLTSSDNPLAQEGLALCKKRMIRPEVYLDWYVCQAGEQFYAHDSFGNLILDDDGRPMGNEYRNRLIIPFYKFGGAWHQFDARALDPENKLRYRNFTGVKREAYNIDFVDFSKPFYILEGTIDSTFIKNSIAIGGVQHLSDMLADNPDIEKNKQNCTIIWDNDEAGMKARVDTVKSGFKWFDWEGISEKDVNGAVMKGQMPLDDKGYVSADFIEGRSRPPEGADILFALSHGDIKKKEMAAKKAARQMFREKLAASKRLGVYF